MHPTLLYTIISPHIKNVWVFLLVLLVCVRLNQNLNTNAFLHHTEICGMSTCPMARGCHDKQHLLADALYIHSFAAACICVNVYKRIICTCVCAYTDMYVNAPTQVCMRICIHMHGNANAFVYKFETAYAYRYTYNNHGNVLMHRCV